MPYPPRLKRLEDLSLHDLEALRLILGGGSVIDWHRLNLIDEAEARSSLEFLEQMGKAFLDEIDAMQDSQVE